MELHIIITDDELTALKETLKISKQDHELATHTNDFPDYAKRILRARYILKLSRSENEATFPDDNPNPGQ